MKILIPEQKKFVHESRIPIRWGDMDAIGHVNNTNYFRYLEIARTDWLMRLNPGRYEEKPTTGAVIVNAFCNFYLPLKFPGEVVAKLYVSDAARVSFDTWVTLELAGQEGKVYAAGGATVVWMDFVAEKAMSLPDWMRSVLS